MLYTSAQQQHLVDQDDGAPDPGVLAEILVDLTHRQASLQCEVVPWYPMGLLQQHHRVGVA